MVVNFTMSYLAITTFPGQVTDRGFANSNGYNDVIAAAERQAALGWSVRTELDGATPILTLAGRDGAPLAQAEVAAAVRRPVGDPARVPLLLRPTAPGRFEATTPLAIGRWDLDLTVTAGGQAFHSTRRLVVKQ
jgi:nitrogen fixation protein FixH